MSETNKEGGASAPPATLPGGQADGAPVVIGGTTQVTSGSLPPRGDRRRPGSRIAAAFLPNRAISAATVKLIVAIQAGIALLLWITSPFKVLPQPGEVLSGLKDLWLNQGLGPELITSFTLNLQALALTAAISLALAYLTVIPFFRPLVAAVSKGRFLSLAGFSLLFTLFGAGGHSLKLSLLVFGMTVFFVTSMAAVIAAIPTAEYDHARTLRMSEWRVVWEVVILGTSEKAFEVLRQNAAIGWMMLTMVEGIARSGGGVGVMLLNQQKHFHIASVFAIQILILFLGLLIDYGIGVIRRLVCPYADLSLARKDN